VRTFGSVPAFFVGAESTTALSHGAVAHRTEEDPMDIMNEHDVVILIAPYEDMADAQRDFTTLRTQLHEKRFELREALLVTRDSEGKPHVVEISNRHARTGAGVGTGVGLLVGLVIPPFLASLAVGAAAGALVTMFADHTLRDRLQHEVGEALAVGTGVVLAMAKPDSKSYVEHVLSDAIQVSALDFAGSSIASLELAVADAMALAQPGTQPS
jgi:uncharacterized membrane protein